MTREEMIAATPRVWEQAVIEEALGEEEAAVCPKRSASWNCGRGCRGVRKTCCTISRNGTGDGRRGADPREIEDVACAHAVACNLMARSACSAWLRSIVADQFLS